MGSEPWPEPQGQTYREASPRLLVGQIALAVFALLTFLWLANILAEHGHDPVMAGLADVLSRNAWIAICLVLLALVLIGEVLLLRPAMREAVLAPAAWAPAANPEPEPLPGWQDTYIEQPAEPQHLLGCPGCGTVFDAHEASTGEGSFGCPNCGRVGRLRGHEPVRADLVEIDCPSCSHHYSAYQNESECPNCGQPIRVKAPS